MTLFDKSCENLINKNTDTSQYKKYISQNLDIVNTYTSNLIDNTKKIIIICNDFLNTNDSKISISVVKKLRNNIVEFINMN